MSEQESAARARAWADYIGTRVDAEAARTGAHWAGGIADRIRKQERRRSFEAGWDAARTDIPAMHAALTAVLALHRQAHGQTTGALKDWCMGDGDYYPCPTVRAINDALGGE
jgi:hypothetical protein